MNKYKYRLSYTKWYALDHFNVDSDDYDQEFDTLEKALSEYKYLKSINVSINWPYSNFTLIKYKDVDLCNA
jgi:hypothetical protein